MWKVRYLNADGDLAEESFDGTLAELATYFAEHEVVVIQRPMPARSGPVDAAEGLSSVSVQKG